MKDQKKELKRGITFHSIHTNKFKTNLFAIFLTTPLTRENVTKNALLAAILRRGSKNYSSQEEISQTLEEMYGGSFDCGIDKTGDNHILKFYLEILEDQYIPKQENLAEKGISILFDIIFNPLVEDNGFKQEYFDGEKQNLKLLIEGKIDNKAKYAYDRCIEEMYHDKPYGLYRYGYIEDIENMDAKSLYEHYRELIQNCKIDIFVSGEVEDIQEKIENQPIWNQIQERKPDYILEKDMNQLEKQNQENEIEESMQVTQGKLVIGLNIEDTNPEERYIASVYNAILGSGSNSKLFQNVREKASLAYSAGSLYLRQKNNIFIKCGIEIANKEKAMDIIKQQLEEMKNGDFSEQDIENAKKLITAGINSIPDEQDTEITYYLGQELSNSEVSLEEYLDKIRKVTKQQIIEIAKRIRIHTIYFLKDEEKGKENENS